MVSGCRDLGVPGLVPVHLCVGLGPEPSDGQGVSQGGWVLKGSLRRLPTGGWGCVPARLAVWPEASQYWCSQAGAWGWVPVLVS